MEQSFFLVLLVYFNDNSGLNIIIGVLSSLSNSGLSLINSDNNLALYSVSFKANFLDLLMQSLTETPP